MNWNYGWGAGVALILGEISTSSVARADTASFPAVPAPSPAPALPAPPPDPTAPSTAQPSDASPDRGAPPAASSPASASTETPGPTPWVIDYAHARADFAQGKFRRAADAFGELAKTASSPERRALCAELAKIAEQWAEAGLTLTLPRAPAESAPLNQRTTDEISILYLNSVVYGLGTGVWVATLTKPQDAATAILPALTLAGGAAGAVALFDRSPLGYGVPASTVSGMYIGLEEGITWSLWNQAKAPYFDEWQGSTVATVIWGSATAGAIAGGVVGATAGTTPGRASYVGSSALWGGLLSGLVLAAASSDDRGQRDDHALLAAAVGTNLGVVGGLLSAGPLSPSVARVRFIDLGGIAGGILASGLYVSGANNSSDSTAQGFFGVTALGVAGGLVLASFLTKDMPADHGMATDSSAPSAFNVEPTLLPVHGGTMIGALGTF